MKEQDTGEYDMLAELVDEIHAVLDGVEWSADTCQEIADILQAAGCTIREPRP